MWLWLTSHGHKEGGFLPASPLAEGVQRSQSQYCPLSVCMTATLGRAWLPNFTKSSREVKLFQYCAYDASIPQKMVLNLFLLSRADPPLSFTAPYLVFIMKAFVFRNRDSSHMNTYTKENKYNSHFCRRIYYLADQFKSKKKKLYIFEGFSCCCFLHPLG